MPCVPKTYCHSLPPTTCSIPPRCCHRSLWNQLVSQPQECPQVSPPPICTPGFPTQSHSCFNSVKATPICPSIESPITSCVPKTCYHPPRCPPAACCLPPLCGTQSSYRPYSTCPPPPDCTPKFPLQSLTYNSSVKKTPCCPPVKFPVPCAPKTCCHSLPYPPATCCLPPPCGPRASCRRLACPPPEYPPVSRSRNCP